MTRKLFTHKPKMQRRLLLMTTGVIAMGFGLSGLIRLNLGTDPCSCFSLGLAKNLPFSFGTCQLLFQLVAFIFVLRYDLGMIGYGTLGNMVFLGYITDFFSFLWDRLLPSGFFMIPSVRYGLLLPILILFIAGAAAYMAAGLGTSPYDALPFIIARSQNRLSFRFIRIAWDMLFLILGFLLGGTAGAVTILSAFFLGPVIAWFEKKLSVFLS